MRQLRNLGPKSVEMLARAGISTVQQLRATGAVAAYRKVRSIEPAASLNLLYALVGAIEDEDWRVVRRTRKLELLLALDASGDAPSPRKAQNELFTLRNIGPAMCRDLERLGIMRISQLAKCDAQRLYEKLQRITGQRQDPCVLDTFAAAIHQARTGEALPWWHFSTIRKQQTSAPTKRTSRSLHASRRSPV